MIWEEDSTLELPAPEIVLPSVRETHLEMEGAFHGCLPCSPTPTPSHNDPARVEVSVSKSAAHPGLAEAGLSLPHASVWRLPPGKGILV